MDFIYLFFLYDCILAVLDASDVVPSGLLAADIFKLGNFEECINTKVPTEYGFTAQYCLPTINFNRTNLEVSTKNENEWEDPVWIKILVIMTS